MPQSDELLMSRELDEARFPFWIERIPGMPALAERIGTVELRRRLLHMTPGLVPIGLPFTPHSDVWDAWLMLAACAFALVGLLAAVALGPAVVRPDERNWSHAVGGYILPIFGALLLFPGRAEVPLMTLQIVAFGDGSATLGGKFLGGTALPWNRRKTYSGLCCFVLGGTVAATYSYWGEVRPAVPLGTIVAICGAAALCAGIVESLPIRSNDNFRVGMTAATVGATLSSWPG